MLSAMCFGGVSLVNYEKIDTLLLCFLLSFILFFFVSINHENKQPSIF